MKRLNYITLDEWWDTDVNIISDLTSAYDVYVYVLSPSPKRAKYPTKYIQGVKNLRNINYHFRKRNPLSLFFMFYYFLLSLFASVKRDSVNFCMLGWHPFLTPFFYFLFPKKNTILSAHNYLSHSHSKFDPNPYFYKKYKYFHFHSKMQYDLYKNDFPQGIAFYTEMLPKDFGSPRGVFNMDKKSKRVFLFFGLIRDYKRLDLLIQSINKLDDERILVLIAGYCNDFSKYQKMIMDESKFRCEIRFINNDEIPDLFTLSDFIVLPYDDATQSGPSMIALNYGLPIIASDQPAFVKLVEHNKNGFLFDKGNYESLCNVIKNALNLSDAELINLRNNQLSKSRDYKDDNRPVGYFDSFIAKYINVE